MRLRESTSDTRTYFVCNLPARIGLIDIACWPLWMNDNVSTAVY